MTQIDSIISKYDELTGLVAKIAGENRQPTTEELARINALNTEVTDIRKSWESKGRDAFLAGLSTKQEKPWQLVLKADQRLSDVVKGSYDPDFENVSIGRLLRGYVTGDWSGAPLEQKAMASSPTSAGGMMIPTPLSSRVIDLARAQAVVMRAGAVTVPMEAGTLKVPRTTQDISAGWYSEAAAITASDMAFDSITFTARKLAALVVVNNELFEDGQRVDGVIENSIAQALALKLDLVALTGSGTAPEPRGLQNVSGINTTTSVGSPADYSKFLTAIFEVIKDNFQPNAIVYSARTAESLSKLYTGISGDKTPLPQPAEYSALSKYVSTQVPNNLGAGTNESIAFVGQWNQLAIGMRKNLMIEVAREGSYDISGTHYSAFQKDQTLIRATLRCDVQCFQPTAFTLMSGILA